MATMIEEDQDSVEEVSRSGHMAIGPSQRTTAQTSQKTAMVPLGSVTNEQSRALVQVGDAGEIFLTEQKYVKREAQRDCVLGMNKHVQRSRPQRHTKKLSNHLIVMIVTRPSKLNSRHCTIRTPGQ